MATGYTNIRYILDRIMQHPLLQDITLEQVVDQTISFMRIVGVPAIFDEKVSVLTLSNYRVALPTDFYQMIQIRTGTVESTAFRYAEDSFHLTENKNDAYELTYKIQGGILYTSIEDGDIEISYMGIAVDNEGYPLIPDNSSFTRALELFIKKYWFTILFDLGKISPAALSNVQTEYAWAVGDCESEFKRLTLDQAESFYNQFKTLIIRDSDHSKGFLYTGSKEIMKLH